MRLACALAGLLAACATSPPTTTPPAEKPTSDAPRMIERLGSNEIAERDEAERALIALGEPALRFVDPLTAHADAELSARAHRIVRAVRRDLLRAKGRLFRIEDGRIVSTDLGGEDRRMFVSGPKFQPTPMGTRLHMRPGGGALLIHCIHNGMSSLHVLDLQREQMLDLLPRGTSIHWPFWSPDGTRIACIVRRSGAREDVTVYDLTSRATTSFPQPPLEGSFTFAVSSDPWTPDSAGLLLCSVRRQGDSYEARLGRYDLAGTERATLHTVSDPDAAVFFDWAWSPDATALAITAQACHPKRPWHKSLVLWRDGGTVPLGPSSLTFRWSPDGRRLLFAIGEPPWYAVHDARDGTRAHIGADWFAEATAAVQWAGSQQLVGLVRRQDEQVLSLWDLPRRALTASVAGDIHDLAAVDAATGLVLFYRVVERSPTPPQLPGSSDAARPLLRLALCALDVHTGIEVTLCEAREPSEDGSAFLPALIWIGP